MLVEYPGRNELLVLLGKRCPKRVREGVAFVDGSKTRKERLARRIRHAGTMLDA
jgi:hypothetical protein